MRGHLHGGAAAVKPLSVNKLAKSSHRPRFQVEEEVWEKRERADDCGKVIKYFFRRVSSLRLCVSEGHALPCARAAALGSAAGAPEQPFMNEAPEGGGGDFSYNNSLLLGFIHSLQSQCNWRCILITPCPIFFRQNTCLLFLIESVVWFTFLPCLPASLPLSPFRSPPTC